MAAEQHLNLTKSRPITPSTCAQRRKPTPRDGSMRRVIKAVGIWAFAMMTGVGMALAGYGALALDERTLQYGFSSNEETQTKADDVALKECGSDKCKIVFRTAPGQCGAIATAENRSVWGGAKRPKRAAAQLAAVQNCQKRTKSQCKARSVECNR